MPNAFYKIFIAGVKSKSRIAGFAEEKLVCAMQASSIQMRC